MSPRRRWGILAIVLCGAAGSALAEPHLPPAPVPTAKFPGNDLNGLRAEERRQTVPRDGWPWRALGRLSTPRGFCTGALIAPSIVLTAAHCVFDPERHTPVPAEGVRFALGYGEGQALGEASGQRIVVPGTYDPSLPIKTLGSDWALVRLVRSLAPAAGTLPLRERTPSPGTPVVLAGYSKDRAEQILADRDCRVIGLMFDRDGMPVAHHDCSGTHGVSGAPLLVEEEGRWMVVGIDVAAEPGGGGTAVLLVEARAMLAKLEH